MLNSSRNVFTGSRGTMPNASRENTHMDFGMIAHKPTTTRGGEKKKSAIGLIMTTCSGVVILKWASDMCLSHYI